MKVTRKDIDNLNAVLTVNLVEADYSEKYNNELRKMRQRVDMPGFRKGMVPKTLVEKLYGSSIKAQVLNDVLGDGLSDYIKNEKLDILGAPLPVEEEDQTNVNFELDKEFNFSFDIAFAPALNVNYGVEVPVYDIAVDDSMVEEQVLRLRQNFGTYSTPESAEDEDIIRGTVSELVDENPIVNEHAVLSISRLKDEEQKKLFSGAKKDDVITFNPRKAMVEDAEIAAFLGKKSDEIKENDHDFSFTVSEISRYTQAEIGKELFEKVYGPDAVKDEAEFRGKVKEDIKAQLRADEDYRFEIDARNAIIEQLKDLAMPEAFLRRYLKTQNEKVDDETFDKEFPGALEALKWQLVEDEIGKKHELKLTEDDLQQEARNFVRMQLRQYGLSNAADDLVENFATESLKREEDRRRIADRALQVKIFDALKQDMKLKPTSITLADFNKLFEQEAKK
ncbi:MAG: hypothetical protein IJU35_00665 [Paludibacteraceae bacterium]|nr:hypothetical protein [Paludibacteraceae bacterium]